MNLCMTPCDALAFLTQPAYVRAAIPVEERLGILAETQETLVSVAFTALEELHHVGVCIVSVSLAGSMKSLFTRQSVIPKFTALE